MTNIMKRYTQEGDIKPKPKKMMVSYGSDEKLKRKQSIEKQPSRFQTSHMLSNKLIGTKVIKPVLDKMKNARSMQALPQDSQLKSSIVGNTKKIISPRLNLDRIAENSEMSRDSLAGKYKTQHQTARKITSGFSLGLGAANQKIGPGGNQHQLSGKKQHYLSITRLQLNKFNSDKKADPPAEKEQSSEYNAVKKLSYRIDDLSSRNKGSDKKIQLQTLKTPTNNIISNQKSNASISTTKNYHPKENHHYFSRHAAGMQSSNGSSSEHYLNISPYNKVVPPAVQKQTMASKKG